MATLAETTRTADERGTRFYLVMACVMSATIVGGFSLNLAMGRSSFDAPVLFHVHGIFFMSWIGLYLGQHLTANAGNWALHARLGRIAYAWVPLMVAAGGAIMIFVAQHTGGPFFFAKHEFLISNLAMLACFGALALWALRVRRHTGWHRRLMLCAMAVLTGPGIGRLLPMPLLVPHAWTICIGLTFVFPLIGMAADLRRSGRVHPGYLWGLGLYVTTFAISMVFANTSAGLAVTDWIMAGTAGADRPMEAYIPPGFTM